MAAEGKKKRLTSVGDGLGRIVGAKPTSIPPVCNKQGSPVQQQILTQASKDSKETNLGKKKSTPPNQENGNPAGDIMMTRSLNVAKSNIGHLGIVESPMEDHTNGSMSPYTRIKGDLEILMSEFDLTMDYKGSYPTIVAGSATAPAVDTEKEMSSRRGNLTIAPKRHSFEHLSNYSGNIAIGRKLSQSRSAIFDDPHLSNSLVEVPSRSLWIGNLDPTFTEDELGEEFSPFGLIESLRLLPAKECAFVNYFDIADAARARDAMQGKALGNMIIRIGFGKSEGIPAAGQISGGMTTPNQISMNTLQIDQTSTYQSAANTRSVWIGNIHPDVTEELLSEKFSKYGPIESYRLLESRNCAFVNFYNSDDSAIARHEMNGVQLAGNAIKTGFAKPNSISGLSSLDGLALNANQSDVINRVAACGVDNQLAQYYVPSSSSANGAAIVIDNRNNFSISSAGIPISGRGSESPYLSALESSDYSQPIPLLPADISLPPELNANDIKELRRQVEFYGASVPEIDELSEGLMENMISLCVDPLGNILVQRLIEKTSLEVKMYILQAIGDYMSVMGSHKHGTWVVQRIINTAVTTSEKEFIVSKIKPYVVNMMKDQYGNYVIQCCLQFDPCLNQFVYDALYHCCLEIASSRFGSRAMKSCLESPTVTKKQQKFVAMAIINHAASLIQDCNRVIVLQWLLDSDLPGRFAFLAPVLQGRYAEMCLSKHASAIVAKMIQPTSDPAARNVVIKELLESPSLPILLAEPQSAAILLRALTTASLDQKYKIARSLISVLEQLDPIDFPHLEKIFEEVRGTVAVIPEMTASQGNFIGPSPVASPNMTETNLLTHAVGGPIRRRSSLLFIGSDLAQTSTRKSSLDSIISNQASFLFGTFTTYIDPSNCDGSVQEASNGNSLGERKTIHFGTTKKDF